MAKIRVFEQQFFTYGLCQVLFSVTEVKPDLIISRLVELTPTEVALLCGGFVLVRGRIALVQDGFLLVVY